MGSIMETLTILYQIGKGYHAMTEDGEIIFIIAKAGLKEGDKIKRGNNV